MLYNPIKCEIPLPVGLTDEQKGLIAQLKQKIDETWQELTPKIDEKYYKDIDEYTCYRFLKARKWDVTDGYNMLKEDLIWRNESRIDEIQFDDIKNEFYKGKAFYYGHDSENRLVGWIRVHLHISSETNFEEMKKMCLWFLDESYYYAKAENPTALVIFDMSKFSITKNMDYKLVKFLLATFFNHYPETLGLCLIVNSPWIFNGCWKLIRPWIDPVTAEKIKFIKTEELKNYLSEDIIFTDLGGKLELDINSWLEEFKDNYIKRKNQTNELNAESNS